MGLILYSVLILSVIALALADRFYGGEFDRGLPKRSEPVAIDRKLAAKRTNEGIKLSATCCNNLSVGLLIGGLIGPTAAGHDPEKIWYGSLIILAGAMHYAGRSLLNSLKSEE